jgi:phenylpropionate dioxygenase-like ring-hydroxylating dioxygenase large terminal subunit
METRHLLPADAYWSQEWFDREQDAIFSRTWHLVASEDELAEPGRFVTYTAGRDPLVVVRDGDGNLRAFHNLCRHRGMPLVEGCGQQPTGLVCPYHFWNFGLDGALRKVPQPEQFPDLDVAEWGLLPASVDTWGGLVFVHPDPEVGSMDAWLGDLPDNIGSYRPELLEEVGRMEFEVRGNWKLFVENHVDVYHLWYLHARTLSDYDHDAFEWQQLGNNWVSYEPVRDEHRRRRPEAVRKPIDHIAERDRQGVGAHALFPNVLMASEAGYFITYPVRPVAPDRCVVDLRVRAEAGADGEALLAGAKAFITEDIAACEGLQSTIRSDRFGIGPMAVDHERPITLFHEHLLAALDRK